MARFVVLLAVVCVPSCVAASPPPQDPNLRPQICLNGEWQFQPADNDLSFPPRGQWDKVPIRIPSPWNVNSFSRGDGGDFNCFPSYPRAWEGVMAAWHRRTFAVPEIMRGKAVFLRFEAVSYWADVYVNGKKAGSHEGHFTPFELNVTDLVKVGEENELLVGVKAHQLFDVKGRATYGWGSFWGGHIHGIWQDVHLIARPKVYVSDVFVKTSVQEREITVETTVTNLSKAPWQGQVRQAAWMPPDFRVAGKQPVKELPAAQVTLAPGETKTVTTTAPWQDPVLWWTYDAGPGRSPHLYILQSVLDSPTARDPQDAHCLRFGFKEFTIGPGRKFLLNGVTFSGRGDAWHFMGVPQCTPAYAKAWYEMAMSAHVNIIRLHAMVYPEYYLDVADEMGMLIVDESALWGSAINFYYNEDFLRRAKAHVQELVLRDRNHPSVALWSVANEIYARQGDDNAPSQDWIFARYAEWAQEMKRLDPTREVSSDGDNDLGGRLNIYSLHYPGAGDPKVGKIATIGEAGSMFYSTPPEVAHAIGDRAYLTSNDRMEACGIETADLIEGYRKWAAYAMPFNLAWYGLEPLPMDVKFKYDDLTTPGMKPERLGPYCTMLNAGRDPKLPAFIPNPLYHAVKDAFTPIRFFIRERSCVFWERATITRHLTVHNDILEPSELALEWALRGRGGIWVPHSESHGTLASGRMRLSLQPGEMREVEITVPMPEVVRSSAMKATLDLRLLRGSQVCHRQKLDYTVLEEPNPKAMDDFERAGWSLAIYDPRGQTTAALEWVGARMKKADSPEALARAGATLSIVGAGSGITHAQALLLDDIPGPLVVYEDNPAFYGEDMYATRHRGSYVRGFNRGLFTADTLPSEWLQFWGDDGVIARAACGREVHGNIRPLVTCGDGDLAAFVAYNGPLPRVFCELAVSEKWRQEAAAHLVLVVMLGMVEPEEGIADRATRILAESRSRFAVTLDALGVQETWGKAQVLLCDGSQPPPDPEQVRTFLAHGKRRATLVLFGLVPETVTAWNEALPVSLKLHDTDAVQLIRADSGHELIANVDHRDLFWIEQSNTRRIMDYGVSCDAPEARALLSTNRTDWRRWCWQGENIKTAAIVRSEREALAQATGLLEHVDGDVQIVVSQVRLDPMNPKSMRFYNQLLTNLGVPLRRGKAADLDMTPFNVDPDGFITAWLVCGAFAGDRPHETDFAGGEAGLRPEIGTVSGPCIWRAFRSEGPVLDFTRKELFGRRQDCAAYAATYVQAPRDMSANLWLGSDDSVKVWLNGEQVYSLVAGRPVTPDSDKIPGLKLKKGWNLLLFKVSQGWGEWGLCARLVDDAGKPLECLTVSQTGPAMLRKELSREGWKATASDAGESPMRAIDGDPATRWTSGRPMEPGMWWQLDLGKAQTVSRVTLDSAGSPGDYPRGLRIEGSQDGENWQTLADCPDVTPAQQGGVVTVVTGPQQVRYLKLTQTGPTGCSGGLYWSLHEVRLEG